MQSNILYDRSTTLPNMSGHVHRPRIDQLLDGLLDRHLVTVTAGAGWGKTHAVSAYLHHASARVIWFQLSELDNHLTRFWEEFLFIMAFQNKETADQLEQLGFPKTLAQFDKFLHILANEIYTSEQVVFVLDDFHLIYDEEIVRFTENLIVSKLENFCIIINSRSKLSFNLTGMFANGLAGQLSAEDLHFSLDETEVYLKQQDIALSRRELEKVQAVTEGWPMALYLVGLSIKKGGMVSKDPIAGAIPFIFDMIERELFSDYTPTIRNFLIRASLLNSFPEYLIKALAGDQLDVISEFINNNMFIYYNPYTGNYNFHHLFLEFLKGKQSYLTQQEMTDTYLQAAEWCAAHNLKIEALVYYDMCGRYDEILDIMFHFGAAVFSKTIADLYISLIDNFPAELMKKYPVLHIHHAGLVYNNAEIQPAINELLETQRELETPHMTEADQAVLGEVYCMLGLINLGIGNYDFQEQFRKASEYMPNGGAMIDNKGRAVNTRYAITLNSPAPGELKKMEEALFYGMPYATKVMHGYGMGLEYLASAEAAYFTGDMKKASKNAYEAIYRAREKQVYDIVSSGHFLLMRVEAANGNYKGIVSHLDQMKAYVESMEENTDFIGMPDVAEGWLHLLTGHTEKIANWLSDDSLGSNLLAPYSMGMERSITARYLLKEGKDYQLLAWLKPSEELFRRYNLWFLLLDNLIYKAIASHRIQDEEQAAAALREAYEIAHGNNLIMQFVELGNDIRSVVYNVKNNQAGMIPDAWLDEIYTKAATYEKHVRSLKSQDHQTAERTAAPQIKCTKREKEMLGYLCKGLTNQEIANTCFITISAVKKSLNNVYIKLGATNRADAVRIALQMGVV